MTTKNIFNKLIVLIGVVVFGSLLAVFVSFAQTWTAPTAGPPAGNTPAPVNVGASAQSKAGEFRVNQLFSSDKLVVGPPISQDTKNKMQSGAAQVKSLATDDVYVQFDGIIGNDLAIGSGIANFLNEQNLPVDALEVWGKIAMKGGTSDTDPVDTRIVNVDSPINNRDVATKGYVDAQVGGSAGWGTQTLTLFGTSPALPDSPYFYNGPNSGVFPGRNGFVPSSSFWQARGPGEGTPACSGLNNPDVNPFGKWVEIFAGYGPHNQLYQYFFDGSEVVTGPNNEYTVELGQDLQLVVASGGGFTSTDVPAAITSINNSVCSASPLVNVAIKTNIKGINGGSLFSAGAVGACADGAGCNTCRICQFVPNP
jgi:hypothetical protein